MNLHQINMKGNMSGIYFHMHISKVSIDDNWHGMTKFYNIFVDECL